VILFEGELRKEQQGVGLSWVGYRYRSSLPMRCTFQGTQTSGEFPWLGL